jgi:hypothetical protein
MVGRRVEGTEIAATGEQQSHAAGVEELPAGVHRKEIQAAIARTTGLPLLSVKVKQRHKRSCSKRIWWRVNRRQKKRQVEKREGEKAIR